MKKGYLRTPIGLFEIAAEGGRLEYIELIKGQGDMADNLNPEDVTEGMDPLVEEAKIQLTEYLEGTRRSFDLPVNLKRGTEFQQKVWKVLMDIPYGKTLSYGEVAKRAGSPKGFRAAGNAVGKNPFLIVVPCHRVIKGDGTIGGFSSGLALKRDLFAVEGIRELCRK